MITGSFIGEVKRSRDRGGKGYTKWIWLPCCDCGKERWVQVIKVPTNEVKNKRCQSCSAKFVGKNLRGKHTQRFSGRLENQGGYVCIKLSPDDFFYSMATSRGYVFEHRLIVAKALGRCLHRWEIVHHKNHIRDDNRIGNLQLVSDDRHKQITILENRIAQVEKRVLLLEAENVLLQAINQSVSQSRRFDG